MSDRLGFYFKQHKHLLKPFFDCFLTCSIIKVTCNININNFGLLLKVFTLLTVYILSCLTNKLFVDGAYKNLIPGKYLNKSYKSNKSYKCPSTFPSFYYLSNVFIGQDGTFCSVKIC